MQLVFATNNLHKLEEIKQILGYQYEIISLKEIQCFDEIPEDHDTFEGNALQKARYIYDRYGVNCFADDTGLEIEALHQAPGVYSARYSGKAHDAEANMKKVLSEMDGIANRKARFRTVIALILDGQEYFFEGIVNGEVLSIPRGNNGFGYDPIFQPEGSEKSFAEMNLSEKNDISHRARAVEKLCSFLQRR